MKQQEFKIKIKPQFSMTKRQLYQKLKDWLEHNGHTSVGHGFEFDELSYLGEDE